MPTVATEVAPSTPVLSEAVGSITASINGHGDTLKIIENVAYGTVIPALNILEQIVGNHDTIIIDVVEYPPSTSALEIAALDFGLMIGITPPTYEFT